MIGFLHRLKTKHHHRRQKREAITLVNHIASENDLSLDRSQPLVLGANSFGAYLSLGYVKFSRDVQLMHQEYQNVQQLAESHPELEPFLPEMTWQQTKEYAYILMPRYQKPKRVPLAKALRMLKIMQPSWAFRPFDIDAHPVIAQGLEALKMHAKCSQRIVHNYKQAIMPPHPHGLAHGDFHQGNLMIDQTSRLKVIDWDVYSEQGLGIIDAFTLINSIAMTQEAKPWYDCLTNTLRLIESQLNRLTKYYQLPQATIRQGMVLFAAHQLGQSLVFYPKINPKVIQYIATQLDATCQLLD